MFYLVQDLLSGKRKRVMKKEKQFMLNMIIKGMIKEGYGSSEIYNKLLVLGSGYRKTLFLEDYKRLKEEIEKEESEK